MLRRYAGFALVAVAVAQAGCLNRCSSRASSLTGHTRGDTTGQLTGRNATCFDAAGRPIPCPPEVGFTSMPIGVPSVAPGANELHMPAPTDLIPRSAVPLPAPPSGLGSSDASLPYPVLPGTPVKQK
jgi:hypothetical protein